MKIPRNRNKPFLFSALLLIFAAGFVLWRNHLNAPPQLPIPAYPQTPKINGFDLYVEAANAMRPAKPPVDLILDDAPPDGEKARAKRYSLVRKTAWLRANRKAFALFERAQKAQTLAPSLRAPRTSDSLKTIRNLARAKRVEIRENRLRGNYNGALKSGLDSIQLGHDIRRGAPLIYSLVGARWNDETRAEIEGLTEKVGATQAKNSARRMENLLQSRWNLDDALVEDKYCFQLSWPQTFKQQDSWRYLLIATQSPSDFTAFIRSYFLSKQNVVDETGAEFDRQIANARLPYADKGVATPSPQGLVFDDFASFAAQWRYENAGDLAGDRLLMLQLALRAYRLENGQYPSALNALAPHYLKTIPADPFGAGEPMHYKRSGQKYILWSIGPDEKDNGGTPIPPNKDENDLTKKRLPGTLFDSQGDFVAGKNRAIGFELGRI